MNAISIPEKKAEKIKDKTMIIPAVPTIRFDYPVGVAQISFGSFF